MRTEIKKIDSIERINCYKTLDPEADVFPDAIIVESLINNTYRVEFDSTSFRVNSKETALAMAELYINDLGEL